MIIIKNLSSFIQQLFEQSNYNDWKIVCYIHSLIEI
jgi:hypothetical protein